MRSTAFLIRSSLVLAFVSAGAIASAQTASAPASPTPGNGPLSAALRDQYNAVKLNVTEAAAKMAEADYGFRPVDTVRTFGEFVVHIAEANLTYCALAKGDPPPGVTGWDKLTTKAQLGAALAKAIAYCDEVYGAMTDEKALASVKAGRTDMPAGALLFRNVSHTNEHYGNLVTYMRIKGLVPPSTERAQQQRR
ncbi:MAG: DinB family protein [Vicinamibacteraceae bacterium]